LERLNDGRAIMT